MGKVIVAAGMVDWIQDNAEGFVGLGLFFPFLLAALLKTAQGSSTVAITTVASMIVSHANDSYFWVITQLGGLTPAQGYRSYSLMTLVLGCTAMTSVFILSLFLI